MGKGGHRGHGGHGGHGHGGFGHGGHGHHHHRHHGPGIRVGVGVGVGVAAGYGMRRRARRGYRGGGRAVIVVNPPPPSPIVVSGIQITHFSEQGDTTFYHIQIKTFSGHSWEVLARYSALEALYGRLKHARVREPFPGSMPIRSFFGLTDHAKDNRRIELERWLSSVVQVSESIGWMRSHINHFLLVPAELLTPVTVISTTTGSATGGTSAGGASAEQQPPASPSHGSIQVAMPDGVGAGELLEIEVNGEVFHIPAPEGVAAGTIFEVALPEPDQPLITAEVVSMTEPSVLPGKEPPAQSQVVSAANPF